LGPGVKSRVTGRLVEAGEGHKGGSRDRKMDDEGCLTLWVKGKLQRKNSINRKGFTRLESEKGLFGGREKFAEKKKSISGRGPSWARGKRKNRGR